MSNTMVRVRVEAAGWGRALLAALLGLLTMAGTAMATEPAPDGGSALVDVTVLSAADGDSDGLTDTAEAAMGTDPARDDSDDDNLPDGYEVWNGLDALNFSDASADVDKDGIDNFEEYVAGTLPYAVDTDEDAFWDGIELARSTDPTSADSYPVRMRPGDISCDGVVDAMDVQLVINAALMLPVPVPANVNDVEGVDAADIQTVVNALLQR